MPSNVWKGRVNAENVKFTPVGGTESNHAVLTRDVGAGSNILAIAGETVTMSAGAAGTTGVVALDKSPIMNADGALIGRYGDTSFAWVTGTILTTAQAYDHRLSDTEMLAALAGNGSYAIDYVKGRLFYKKATSGTSDTCNYKTRQLNLEVTVTATTDTELPAAVLLADNADVPTAPAVGAFGMMYDGAKFDMVRGDATNGLLVNLGANNDVDTELPTAALLADNADVPTAPAVGAFNMVYDGAKFDMQRGDATDGTLVNLGTNNDVTVTGSVQVPPSAAAVGPDVALDSSIDNTAQSCKAAAGALYGMTVYNPNVTAAYVQFFDAAVGAVTPGVTAPKFWIPIPPQGAIFMSPGSAPLSAHANAITYCATTTPTGGVATAAALEGCFFYK